MTNGNEYTGHLTVRAPKDLLQRLGRAVKLADPDMSASDAVRGLVRWYLGEASLPKLPPGDWRRELENNNREIEDEHG